MKVDKRIHIEKVKEVQTLRNKNKLPFRKIATLVNADVKTVYRWYKYDVGSYPQVTEK